MSRRSSIARPPAGAAALLLLLAGIAGAAVALVRLPRQRADMARDLKMEAELRGLRERIRAIDHDFETLRARGDRIHPTPEECLRQVRAEDGRERIEVREPVVYLDQWKLHRVSIDLSGIPPAALGRWMEACAAPPSAWRLASLKITALDPQALLIRAETVWECAEKLYPGEPGEDAGAS